MLGATGLAAALLGSAGIAGIALGFAFRDLLENYIAGVLLSIRQPFAPDDIIRLDEREGVVVAMNSRATILMTHDGNHLTIPNSIVFKAVILNLTRNGNRRFNFVVDLDPGTELNAALAAGQDAIGSTPDVLESPPPFVQVVQVGHERVQLQFFAWVDQRTGNFGNARSEAFRRVREKLESIGAYFGPPQLHLVSAAQASNQAASAVPVPPAVTPATTPDERLAVDTAIEMTRAEMGDSDLLRRGARE
jgi:small-conductance mechanosensitive channel